MTPETQKLIDQRNALQRELGDIEDCIRQACREESGLKPGAVVEYRGGILKLTRVDVYPSNGQIGAIYGNKRKEDGSFGEREWYICYGQGQHLKIKG